MFTAAADNYVFIHIFLFKKSPANVQNLFIKVFSELHSTKNFSIISFFKLQFLEKNFSVLRIFTLPFAETWNNKTVCKKA